jgi:hypothetical protein
MKTKQTTWSYSAIDNFIMCKDISGARVVVCEVSEGHRNLQSKRLIAAAPEMLDALESLLNELNEIDYVPESVFEFIDKAHLAIKKARGES